LLESKNLFTSCISFLRVTSTLSIEVIQDADKPAAATLAEDYETISPHVTRIN